jgi:hypothetical protein
MSPGDWWQRSSAAFLAKKKQQVLFSDETLHT